MLSSIFAFLGGSAFRMIWGELSHWLTEAREHKREIERMQEQEKIDAAAHLRNLESIRLQHDLNVEVIHVQAEADISRIEADGWVEAVKATGRAVGVAWVDAWNAAIRPGVATWSICMLTADAYKLITIPEATGSVCFAALGIYLADRTLGKRGK